MRCLDGDQTPSKHPKHFCLRYTSPVIETEAAGLLTYILSGITLGFSAVASPGPFQAYIISQTLKNGWRQTLLACLAPLVSDGPIIAIVLLVLTRLPTGFLQAIQIGGGLLLIYFAWRAANAFRVFSEEAFLDPRPKSQNLGEAALVNALSPGPWIFWSLIAGPILLAGWRITPSLGILFLLSFYSMLVGGIAALILLIGSAHKFGARVNRALLGFSALLLLVFGLYQLQQGLT
jgi:threonine/homoserine/homoserine lactone efflux protein